MRVLHERCCGLDVHKKFVVACLLTTSADGTGHKEVRTYSAMTNDLLALADWLRAEDGGPVVMEWRRRGRTGVRCSTCWRSSARSSSSTPTTSRLSRAARPMSRMPSG